jgi:hypothetical protein
MGLQTLYLEGSAPIAVLGEGPALRLRRPEQADVYAPLARLGRVVARGDVHWRAGALEACLAAGVAVVFLDRAGETLGACVPAAAPSWRSDLPDLLDTACVLAGFEARMADWFRALEREAIRALLRRIGLGASDLRPARVRAALAARAAGPPDTVAALRHGFSGLLRAQSVEILVRHGVGPQFLAARCGAIDLAGQLAEVLSWSCWPALWRLSAYLVRHATKHRDPAALRARLVRAFEAEAPRLEAALTNLIRRLAWSLRAMVG